MGRSPCCSEVGLKKGPWTPEEDKKLTDYINKHGHGSWRRLPELAGLNRCGKSCRLRWTNYLRPDIRRGKFSEEEEQLIIDLHSVVGNKWSSIATRLPGRTDNEIKNYWNTHLRKKLLQRGIDPVTHRPRTDHLSLLAGLPSLLASANFGNLSNHLDNAIRLQADAAQLLKLQLLQNLVHVLTSSTSSTPNLDLMSLFGSNPRSFQVNDLAPLRHQLESCLVNNNGALLNLQSSTPMTSDNISSFTLPELTNNYQPIQQSYLSSSSDLELGMDTSNVDGGSTNNGTGTVPPAVNSTTASQISVSPDDQTPRLDRISSYSDPISASSSTSGPFEAWEDLNLDDLHNDLGWKEILDQISWSNAA